jgi:predicted ribosomally synthesized peptide with SipW-like signal peptide
MKKIGLFVLVIILALGAMGSVYAYWSRTLTVTNTVTTGIFNPQFGVAASDDDGTTGNAIDPTAAGTYSGSIWTVNRTGTNQDVGKTTAAITTVTNTNDTLTITLGDNSHPTYPGYFATVYCTVVNNGNVPIKVVAASPVTTVLTGGGAATDVGVSVSGVLTGTTPIIAGSASSAGYITVGIGNVTGGGTTDPPVGGGTYKVTFTVTASQFNSP